MQRLSVYFFSLLIIVSVLAACTTRRVKPGQVMLKKVFIKCDNPNINKEEVFGYTKQKPNRKLIGINYPHLLRRKPVGRSGLFTNGAGFPFYLYIYNLVDPEKEKVRKEKRRARYMRRDAKYKNLSAKKKARRHPPRERKTIGEFLYSIGEAPVVLDSSKTSASAAQMKLYLKNKGYFDGTVSDTVIYPWFQRVTGRYKKAIVVYTLKPEEPYLIDSVYWDIHDPNIAYDISTDTAARYCLLKRGDVYDANNFEAERDRITLALRNNGYFLFSKDFIRFVVYYKPGVHHLDVKIVINKQQVPTSDSTWVETNHQRFSIRNITVKSMYTAVPTRADNSHYDTTMYQDMAFLRNTDSLDGLPYERVLRFKPEVLASRIIFRPNKIYKQSDYEETFRQLTSLRVFRQVVIDPVPVYGSDQLDIVIRMYPVSRQSYTTQMEGTNTGGNLGIGGSFAYNNNNLFHGAEQLEFKIKGGTEAQQPIAASQSGNNSQLAFNTIEAGSEASLYFPREFFPFNLFLSKNRTEDARKAQERRTFFTASFNYQRRIDYDRSIGNLAYGYTFRYKRFARFSIYPAEVNVVKVDPRAGLLDLLQNGDPLLRYRFTDHLITDSRVTFTWNNQETDPKLQVEQRRIADFRLSAEQSGNLMYYGVMKNSGFTPDLNGSYLIGGIPFAHYLRFMADYRWHLRIGSYEELVMRAVIGTGFPLKNYPTLPLEKGFYGGGANDIRAWEARTLGPGSYVIPADQKYAQFGDVQVEYNVELRFRITKTLGGALFADGGNIWLIKDDPSREGENFVFNRFVNDLAFGPGVGLRYDLSFFVVRIDWGFKLRDPSYPYGERWYIPGQRRLSSNLNFGIGYPF